MAAAAGPAVETVVLDDDDSDLECVAETTADETLYKEYESAFKTAGVTQLQVKMYLVAHRIADIRRKKDTPKVLAEKIRYYLSSQAEAYKAFEAALQALAKAAHHVDNVEFVTDEKHRMYVATEQDPPLTAPTPKEKGALPFSEIFLGATREDNGTKYALMYHGTNGQYYANIAEAIDFTRGGGYLGQGFYLTADPDEAKCYACSRGQPPQGGGGLSRWRMVIEVGVAVAGPNVAPLQVRYRGDDNDLDIRRDDRRRNQFCFTPTTLPNLKIFKWYFVPPRGLSYIHDGCPSFQCNAHGANKKAQCPAYGGGVSMAEAEEEAKKAMVLIKQATKK